MLRKNYVSHLKTLLVSVFLALPSTVFAAGCENDSQMEIFVDNAEQCTAQSGTWYTCMKDGAELEYERSRFECENFGGGVWTVANSIVEIYAPIPKVNSAFIEFNGQSVFVGNDGITGNELWLTDGTEVGTVLLKDITADADSSIDNLTVLNSKLYFTVTVNNDAQLWVSDGTAAGTQFLVDTEDSARDFNILLFNNKAYFNITDGLWETDGTVIGTKAVKSGFNNIRKMTVSGGVLYFAGYTSTENFQLWASDGTTGGTHVINNINPNISVSPSWFMPYDNNLLFYARNSSGVYTLWKTNGTEAGTIQLSDKALFNQQMDSYGDNVIIQLGAGAHGSELSITDGTLAGTSLIKDINPGSDSSYASSGVTLDGKYYFFADDGSVGSALWVTDGTETGTQLVKDITPSTGYTSAPKIFIINNQLYFTADDGTGMSLWESDGTNSGTKELKDITIAVDSNSQRTLIFQFGDKLYFTADEGVHGNELWVSDGTALGTLMLKDITDSGNTDIASMSLANGKVYFSANKELWITDGTVNGTSPIKYISDIAASAVTTPFANITLVQNDSDTVTVTLALSDTNQGSLSTNFIAASSLADAQQQLRQATFTAIDTNSDYSVNASVIVNDGKDDSQIYNHQIYVTASNNTPPSEPTINSSTIVSVAGDSIIGTLQASDVENDDLTFSIVSGNDNEYFSIDENNNLIVTNANSNLTESFYSLVIKSSDGSSETLSTIVFYVTTPVTFNYQGFLSKAGQAVNEELSMTFAIYDSIDGTNEKWSTTKTVTVTDGIYNVVIGLGESTYLNSLNMLNNDYYMGISIAANNEMTPRQLFKPSGFVKMLADKVTVLENKAN
jgi:ELWxxDGT repeat protein